MSFPVNYLQPSPSASSNARTLRLVTRISVAAIFAPAAAFLLAYVWIAASRLFYPFELEWIEGGSVVHVQRVLEHQPLYVRPSLEFTPFIYSPLYYYVSAAPALVLGNGFAALRLVSFVSSLGSFLLIFLIVRRRTGSVPASFVAACLFAATFRMTGGWFDIARVDSMALVLLLAAVYTFDSRRVLVRAILAPVLLFLAFFTKQSALVAGVGLAAATVIAARGWERLAFATVLGMLVAGSGWVMNALSDGWYQYYVFDVPSRHSLEPNMLVDFWTKDIGAHLPIASIVALGALAVSRPIRERLPEVVRDVSIFGGLVASAYISRIHTGGYDNVLMPAAAAIAIFFGFGFAAALERSEDKPAIALIVTLAAAVQFVMLTYSPAQEIPSAAARIEGQRLLQRASAVAGELYWADHPWYAVVAGKRPQAHALALEAVIQARGSSAVRESLDDEMRIAVDEERYAAFIVDYEQFVLRPPNFDRHYRAVDTHLSGEPLRPVTGMRRAPTMLFVRRSRS
jgi:4-amino-4-deoxy-L-arabinose transferase-like glycosyltransferase